MKIVHTGDWHVGKAIRGRQRGDEYRGILEELKIFLKEEKIDLLIVAGDIFDAPTPSAESEDTVYNFFHDISHLGVRSVVIAGNHDSGSRFEAISSLLALCNVKIIGQWELAVEKANVIVPSRNGKEKANIALLPFVPERAFIRAKELIDEQTPDTTRYSIGMGKIIGKLSESFSADAINIFVAHLLMHGARPGGGERRLYLGDNYAVYPQQIPAGIDYVALAHVHLFQHIEASSPMYYCGSTLQLDFGEENSEKGFLFLDAKLGQPCKPEFIPFTSGKKLCSIKGSIDEIKTVLQEKPQLKDAYLKIIMQTDEPTMGLFYQIKKQFPNAVDLRREYISEKKELLTPNTEWLPDLYKSFFQKQYERDVPQEVMEEFEKLYLKCSQRGFE